MEPDLNIDFSIARCHCLGRRKTGSFTAMCFAWSCELLKAPFMLCFVSSASYLQVVCSKTVFIFYREFVLEWKERPEMTSCLSLKTALVPAWQECFPFLCSELWKAFLSVAWADSTGAMQFWYPKYVMYGPSRRGWVCLLCSEHCYVIYHHLWRHLKEQGTEGPEEDPKENCLDICKRSQPQLAVAWNGILVLCCCLPSRCSSLIFLLGKTVGLAPHFFQGLGHSWVPAHYFFPPAPGLVCVRTSASSLGWGDAPKPRLGCVGGVLCVIVVVYVV